LLGTTTSYNHFAPHRENIR